MHRIGRTNHLALLLCLPLALLATACPTRESFPTGTGGSGGGGAAGVGAGGSAGAQAGGGGTAGGQAGGAAGGAGAKGVTGGAGGAAGSGGVGGTVGAAGGAAGSSGGAAGSSGGAAGSRMDAGAGGAGAGGAGCSLVTGVLDFEDLAFTGAFQAVPIPYVHDGFTLTNSTQSLSAVGSESVQYLNTTAVIADPASTTTLARTNGSPFALVKIDLSAYDDGHPGIVYSFTGTMPGGGTVTTMISLLTSGRGFVTYTLPASFANVTQVSWTMNNADNAQYFDNIAYSFCPGGG